MRSGRCHAANSAVNIGIEDVSIDALGESSTALGHLLRVHDLLGLGLLALDALLVDLVVVDLAHFVHNVLALERHEAEAAMALRRLVEHEHGVVYFAVLAEVRLNVLRRRLGRQAAHEYLLRAGYHLFREISTLFITLQLTLHTLISAICQV